ncbi:MAG: MMPL family transporter [Thermoleophilia bacterium]|nr:MMPL family transporter [Thermoleophilia bacterium]
MEMSTLDTPPANPESAADRSSDHRTTRTIRWALEHPWRVVGAWLVLTIASIVVIATLLPGALSTEQRVTNGPESRTALELIDTHLPDRGQVDEVLVVSSSRYEVSAPEFQDFLARLVEQAPDLDVEVAPVAGNAAGSAGSASDLPVSDDGRAILVPLHFTTDDRVDADERLVDAVDAADSNPDFTVTVTGQSTVEHDLNAMSERDLQHGELYVGLPVAMLVLLLVFGTLIGALMPLMIAIVAIIGALALAALVGQQWEVSVFLVNMVSGMGLALGIDYSLFVVSRWREERAAGSTRDAALRTTGATASRAVLFSGITFVVALTGMLLVPTSIMRSLAAGAILVGITSVAAALTLLPATLSLLGDRIDSLRVPLVGRRSEAAGYDDDAVAHGVWGRLVRVVMRRPIVWGGAVTVLLLVAAVPMLGMETGASGVSSFPADMPSRKGAEGIATYFPDQAAQPAQVVVYDSGGIDEAALRRGVESLTARLADEDGFGTPQAEPVSADGTLAVVSIPVGSDAHSVDAVERVRDLRGGIAADTLGTELGDARLLVTGETALNIDYFDVMSAWLPRVLAFVLGLSFLVLLVVFRSLVVPIVAIVLNLLSVGAAYGLLVLVFQHGVGADLLGLQQVDTTEAWVPLFLFSVLFGLSMDYHMFLMTRIRERWLATGDTTGAVAWSVGSTGRLITGAALIIVAVFTGFAIGDLVMFQQMGFGIAVALLIDATLVRGVLLPAAMALLGEHNWYLPRWLRWLPEVQVE